jgi:hypothetical protein
MHNVYLDLGSGVGPGQLPLREDVGYFINVAEPACKRFSASFFSHQNRPSEVRIFQEAQESVHIEDSKPLA